MNRRSPWALCLVFLACAPFPAAAQEAGDFGLVATTSSSVGVVWQVLERLALRPEISFNTATIESEFLSEGDTSSVVGGISAIFTMRRWNDLSVYLSPRLQFSHSSTFSEAVSATVRSRFETSTNGYGVGGSFGAQYMLGERFAVFGETGVLFSRLTSESEQPIVFSDRRTTTTFGSRSAVGVTFYF